MSIVWKMKFAAASPMPYPTFSFTDKRASWDIASLDIAALDMWLWSGESVMP